MKKIGTLLLLAVAFLGCEPAEKPTVGSKSTLTWSDYQSSAGFNYLEDVADAFASDTLYFLTEDTK